MSICSNCRGSVEPRSSWTGPDTAVVNGAANGKERHYHDYTYDQLPRYRGSIRVLVLLGNVSHNAEVECKLKTIEFVKNKPLTYAYEALSWCWGTLPPSGRIVIRKKKKWQSKQVSPVLVAALRALRYQRKDRVLWIDQICINQDNPLEKNHQVEMMSEIYGRASKVCIWLGEGDNSSRMALEFIRKEVLQLQNFDDLCESAQASAKWRALLELMQRPWFSRRWVVQEIALAHTAVVYCGADKLSWKKFAVAVELFVEVETATHRLSEVMKKDPRFYHVPGWFDYVSALGASLLVEATGKLFRDYKPNGPVESEDGSDTEDDSEADEAETDGEDDDSDKGPTRSDIAPLPNHDGGKQIEQSRRQPLLTLEYLVSSLSIFEVTTPHDAVYALLAIARDTTPYADDQEGFRRLLTPTQEALEGFTQKKRYKVDYQQPFADVCQEFVALCIERSRDRTRALDIICRPWAPEIMENKSPTKSRPMTANIAGNGSIKETTESTVAAKRDRLHHRRTHSTLRSGTPTHHSTLLSGGITRNSTSLTETVEASSTKRTQQADVADPELDLPSWIPTLSGAPYAMSSQAGAHSLKMGRNNADTLVGLPPSNQALERNYNAAETKGVDLRSLKFIKRPRLNHWSMYVRGFVLDRVADVQASSQGGAIPGSWAIAGGWEGVPKTNPPDEFWRTLVADRGRDGKNPPVYYSRACKESFAKGGISSGSVNTADLINNERCSVIAQFCRRVQAVIWNRCFIKTESQKLGLTGNRVKQEDLICILYGCSVPVVLHRIRKDKHQVIQEMNDDLSVLRDRIVATYRRLRQDREYRRRIKNLDSWLHLRWDDRMRKIWANDPDGFGAWHARYMNAHIEPVGDGTYQRVSMEEEPEGLEIAPSKIETTEKLLERRAYRRWKVRQRGEMPQKEFEREDRRVFDLQLRWGRHWKMLWRKHRGGQVNGVPTASHTAANVPATPDIGGFEVDVREIVYRYENAYLAPYGLHPEKTAAELEEPDWEAEDERSVRIKEQWCYYKFLGECYVHGVMDGEAMAYQNDNAIPPQVFELR